MIDGPILNDAQHIAALERLEALWDAAPGTAAAVELDRLAGLIHDYEASFLDAVLPPANPGVLLEAKRRELDISQRELARRLGWPSGRTSEVIRGKRELTLRMVRDLVEVLGMDPHTLIRGEASQGLLHLRGDALALLDRLADRDGVPRELLITRALASYAGAVTVHGGGGTWPTQPSRAPGASTLRLLRDAA